MLQFTPRRWLKTLGAALLAACSGLSVAQTRAADSAADALILKALL